ncbi:hypothetical protein [Amycolatopsis sp. WGS_07]
MHPFASGNRISQALPPLSRRRLMVITRRRELTAEHARHGQMVVP